MFKADLLGGTKRIVFMPFLYSSESHRWNIIARKEFSHRLDLKFSTNYFETESIFLCYSKFSVMVLHIKLHLPQLHQIKNEMADMWHVQLDILNTIDIEYTCKECSYKTLAIGLQ